jgi:UDP-N-acetylmuramate: L-alanyl-gamma-D-glutamyl-meso-diaminopimelate ligase
LAGKKRRVKQVDIGDFKRVHFVGVGGTGTGTLAVAMAHSGFEITGSDNALYEPMKSVLANAGIQMLEGFSAENIQRVNPDVVVIGNVIRRDNPEAVQWIQSGTYFISFPEAVRRFVIQNRLSVVCAGTHGKTTTTSWIAYLLKELGHDPSYLIGGVPVDLPSGASITSGQVFVGEGDEYDSAFFDKGPKFLHYHPSIVVLSNIEFDHADIYRDLAHVQSSFEKLIALLPGNGLCVARHEDPVVQKVISMSLCPVQTFGHTEGATWRVGKTVHSEKGVEFELFHRRKSVGVFQSPLFGDHNILNLVSGIAVANNLGDTMDRIRAIVPRFAGCKRRQQILVQEPVVLIDDFAHHPTEVLATLTAVRNRFPTRRLWAFFEPRSATARRGTHQELYPQAFAPADRISLSEPFKKEDLQGKSFSSSGLANQLRENGKRAETFSAVDAIVDHYKSHRQDKDVLVVMSNGEFGKIQQKLLEVLKQA